MNLWGQLANAWNPFSGFVAGFFRIMYTMWLAIADIVDTIGGIFMSLIGIGGAHHNKETGEIFPEQDLALRIMNDPAVRSLFGNMVAAGAALMIFFTIIQIIRENYKNKEGSNPYLIVWKSIKGMVMFLFITAACVAGLHVSTIVLKMLHGATGGRDVMSASGMVFGSMAYDASRLRANGAISTTIPESNYPIFFGMADLVPTKSVIKGAVIRNNETGTVEDITLNSEESNALKIDDFMSNRWGTKDGETLFLMAEEKSTWSWSNIGGSIGMWLIDVLPGQNYLVQGQYHMATGYNSVPAVGVFYDMASFNWIIGFGGLFVIGGVFINFTFGLIQRAIELGALYIMSPITVAMYPFDDGNQFNSSFVKPFYKKVISIYAVVLSINLYFPMVRVLSNIRPGVPKNTTDAKYADYEYFGGFADALFGLIMNLALLGMLPKVRQTVQQLLGADAMEDKKLGESIKSGWSTVTGKGVRDGIKGTKAYVGAGIKGATGFVGDRVDFFKRKHAHAEARGWDMKSFQKGGGVKGFFKGIGQDLAATGLAAFGHGSKYQDTDVHKKLMGNWRTSSREESVKKMKEFREKEAQVKLGGKSGSKYTDEATAKGQDAIRHTKFEGDFKILAQAIGMGDLDLAGKSKAEKMEMLQNVDKKILDTLKDKDGNITPESIAEAQNALKALRSSDRDARDFMQGGRFEKFGEGRVSNMGVADADLAKEFEAIIAAANKRHQIEESAKLIAKAKNGDVVGQTLSDMDKAFGNVGLSKGTRAMYEAAMKAGDDDMLMAAQAAAKDELDVSKGSGRRKQRRAAHRYSAEVSHDKHFIDNSASLEELMKSINLSNAQLSIGFKEAFQNSKQFTQLYNIEGKLGELGKELKAAILEGGTKNKLGIDFSNFGSKESDDALKYAETLIRTCGDANGPMSRKEFAAAGMAYDADTAIRNMTANAMRLGGNEDAARFYGDAQSQWNSRMESSLQNFRDSLGSIKGMRDNAGFQALQLADSPIMNKMSEEEKARHREMMSALSNLNDNSSQAQVDHVKGYMQTFLAREDVRGELEKSGVQGQDLSVWRDSLGKASNALEQAAAQKTKYNEYGQLLALIASIEQQQQNRRKFDK
jgi:hypothetical protein